MLRSSWFSHGEIVEANIPLTRGNHNINERVEKKIVYFLTIQNSIISRINVPKICIYGPCFGEVT